MPGLQAAIDHAGALPWDTIVNNIAADIGGLFTLVSSLAYVLGLAFLIHGFRIAARAANPAERVDSKSAWIWSWAFAAFMFALPTSIASLSITLFGEASWNADNPFSYMGEVKGTGQLAALLPILQLIGVIAVMRGLVVLRAVGMYGNHSRAGASVGRGFVLLIAGVLLVNLQKTLGLVSGISGLNIGAGLFS